MRLLLIVTAIMLMGCSEEEEPPKDCNCDRVVDLNTFTFVGTPENPALNYYTTYTTINDCTGVQKQKEHTTTNNAFSPKIGQCR